MTPWPCLLLAGCTAAATAPLPVVATAPANATLLAVRAAPPSVSVLSALNVTPPETGAALTELLIRRDDGTLISRVLARPAGLRAGDRVYVTQALEVAAR